MYCIKADDVLNIKPIGKRGSGGGKFLLPFTVGHRVRYLKLLSAFDEN